MYGKNLWCWSSWHADQFLLNTLRRRCSEAHFICGLSGHLYRTRHQGLFTKKLGYNEFAHNNFSVRPEYIWTRSIVRNYVLISGFFFHPCLYLQIGKWLEIWKHVRIRGFLFYPSFLYPGQSVTNNSVGPERFWHFLFWVCECEVMRRRDLADTSMNWDSDPKGHSTDKYTVVIDIYR